MCYRDKNHLVIILDLPNTTCTVHDDATVQNLTFIHRAGLLAQPDLAAAQYQGAGSQVFQLTTAG